MIENISEVNMNLYGKALILFPEYHLSDFPPQISFIQSEAEDILRSVNINKADIVISGYVERFDGKMYSSCLIMDQGRTYNLRKKYPYNDENKFISSWAKGSYQIIPLSIGRSYFFLCNDISIELEDDEVLKYINQGAVENFFLISAMGVNFDKHIEKLKNRAIQFGGKNVIYCDRFNGIGVLKIQ